MSTEEENDALAEFYEPGALRRMQRSVCPCCTNIQMSIIALTVVVSLVVIGIIVVSVFVARSLPVLAARPDNVGLQCGGLAGMPNVEQPELDGCGDFVTHGNCAAQRVCRYAVFPARSNTLTVAEFSGSCVTASCATGDGSLCICDNAQHPVCTRLVDEFTFNFACRERDRCGAPSDFRAPIVEGRDCGVSANAPGVCDDKLCIFSVHRDQARRAEPPAQRACLPATKKCVNNGDACECADNVCTRFAAGDGAKALLTFECI